MEIKVLNQTTAKKEILIEFHKTSQQCESRGWLDYSAILHFSE